MSRASLVWLACGRTVAVDRFHGGILLVCVALWALAVILIVYHPFGSWPGPRL